MRLSDELRQRTKQYAAAVIRLFVTLPKDREEIRVLAASGQPFQGVQWNWTVLSSGTEDELAGLAAGRLKM